MENLIITDLNTAYRGEDKVTLVQAFARIAAQFYDPQMQMNRDSGTYEERNTQGWSQKLILQSIGNAVYRQLEDTTLGKDGRPRGLSHQLDRARNYAKSLAMQVTDTEIDIEALNRAADWIERLEAETTALAEMMDVCGAVYEAATGENFKPYAPWETAIQKKVGSHSAKADEVKSRLALLGISVKVDAPLQTNGVDTNERNVA